jgi:hypothetical protein
MSNRNEDSKDITTVGDELPNFMLQLMESGDDGFGDDIKEYIKYPDLKIIQKTTKEDLIELHGIGSCILIPGGTLIATKGEHFDVIPIFRHTEFCLHSSIKDEQSPMILERSYDPNSELAMRARDKDKRKESYPDNDQWFYQWVEHLNFACLISNGKDLDLTPVNISFNKGEFFQGKTMLNAMYQRKLKGNRVPMYLQRLSFTPAFRDISVDQKWWGMDFAFAEESLILDPELGAFCDAQHNELKKAFKEKRLVVDYDVDNTETAVDVDIDVDL